MTETHAGCASAAAPGVAAVKAGIFPAASVACVPGLPCTPLPPSCLLPGGACCLEQWAEKQRTAEKAA